MTYKFVTREEIEKVCKLPYSRFSHRYFLRKLLSERDAYRSMLKGKYQKQKEVTKEEYEKISRAPVMTKGIESYHVFETDWEAIDAEAARIMEGKK